MFVCVICVFFFFFKQKTAYEMRISDWSSDVCSSDLLLFTALPVGAFRVADQGRGRQPRPSRHIVRIPARIEGPGVDRSATIQNISLSGMALEAGLPVNPGKMLTIHLEGLPPMEGRVRWSRGSRCGVLLTDRKSTRLNSSH